MKFSVLAISGLAMAAPSVGFCTLDSSSGTLRIPDGQAVLFSARAEGVQIYTGKQSAAGSTTLEWVLAGPKAELFDSRGTIVAKHYAGPTWEAIDGSKAIGKLVSTEPAHVHGSIPWLLLKVESAKGVGVMSRVSYVMRLDTSGGVHPAAPPRGIGEEVRIKYRATYLFLCPVGTG